jgi:hypothetical protein
MTNVFLTESGNIPAPVVGNQPNGKSPLKAACSSPRNLRGNPRNRPVAGKFNTRDTGIMMNHSSMALGLAALVGAASANAALPSTGSVSLFWDASTSSSIVGYNLYYGAASRVYTGQIALGNVMNTTVNTLTVGTTYYAAVTAVGLLGLESDYSNEQVFTVASGTPILQIGIVNGKITLTGFVSVGAQYNILASQNLPDWGAIPSVTAGTNGATPQIQQSWSAIGSVTGGTNGAIHFTDPSSHSLQSRYYLLEAN